MVKFEYFISSLYIIMVFWNEETLNCLKNSNLKVDFVGNRAKRGCLFLSNEKCVKIAGMLQDLK